MLKVCYVREVDGELEISIPEMSNKQDFMNLVALVEKDLAAKIVERIVGPDAVMLRFQTGGGEFVLIADDFDGISIRSKDIGAKAELERFVPKIEATFQHLGR